MINKSIWLVVVLSWAFALPNQYLTAGFNYSAIKYNQRSLNEQITVDFVRGYIFGFEYQWDRLQAGFRYSGRGAQSDLSDIAETRFISIENYSYLEVYGVYKRPIRNGRFSLLLGPQMGIPLGGSYVINTATFSANGSISRGSLNMDLGLHGGIDWDMHQFVGVRCLYYLGLIDINKAVPKSENVKNRGLSLIFYFGL
ncbi:MAG: outer membrane beta-barrel protein [Candidatus Neomarinimicrobiota bacterium]